MQHRNSEPDNTANQTREPAPRQAQNRPDAGRRGADPLDYTHLHDSLRHFAELLALRYDKIRTRIAYYREMRLIGEHFAADPESLTEGQLRDYFLHVKSRKAWKPKTIRLTKAAAGLFFTDMLGRRDWLVFSQVRARDHEELPAVITRREVIALLEHIRLRRYRTPVKLIYCCGLRLCECLNLTIHDISGSEGKLWVRQGKGGKDRMVPIAAAMVEDLRRYWKYHRHPLLIFPNAGRGSNSPDQVAARMKNATRPMPVSSLQRLIVAAREELNIPEATAHTLRHCFATHLMEAGASIHTVQALLGHKHVETTMIYLHLTHRSEQDSRALLEKLCGDLPR